MTGLNTKKLYRTIGFAATQPHVPCFIIAPLEVLIWPPQNLNENTPGRCMAAVVLEVVLSGAGFHDTPRQD